MKKTKVKQFSDYKVYETVDGTKFLARNDEDAALYQAKVSNGQQQTTKNMVWNGKIRRVDGHYYGRMWWTYPGMFQVNSHAGL